MSTADILRAVGADPDAPAADLSATQLVEALARRLGGDAAPEWMTGDQAATYAGRKKKTIERWAKAGKIEGRRPAGVDHAGRAGNRYSRSSIDKHLGTR